MNKYQYSMSIEAKTEKEAEAKMQALTTLASRLIEKELSKLAHVIRHDPVKTALAKKYLGV
jgi:ribosomal protein L15E